MNPPYKKAFSRNAGENLRVWAAYLMFVPLTTNRIQATQKHGSKGKEFQVGEANQRAAHCVYFPFTKWQRTCISTLGQITWTGHSDMKLKNTSQILDACLSS